MTSDTLKKLYDQSKLLVEPIRTVSQPIIARDLNQIDDETLRLLERQKADHDGSNTAHYFLAQHGFSTQDWNHQLNAIHSRTPFVSEDTIKDTDVEKYLQQAHERNIIQIIEESRENTCLDFEETTEQVMNTNWKNSLRRLQEEWSHLQDSGLSERVRSLSMGNSVASDSAENIKQLVQLYTNAIVKLNDARAHGMNFAIIETLRQVPKTAGVSELQGQPMDMWRLLNRLTGESVAQDGASLEGRFLRSFNSTTGTIHARRQLILSTKRWLEEQFMQYIDEFIFKHALEAKIGGVPSPANQIRAFVDLNFRKNRGWTDGFQIVNDTPIWVYLYFMIRAGHAKAALQFVLNNPDLYCTEANFVSYFKEYMKDPEKGLGKATRDAVSADYQRLRYAHRSVDPYKLLLFKIIGRCELNQKTFAGIAVSTEDYIWLQLSLVRENPESEEYGYERYCLRDLQNLVVGYGSELFDPTGSNPWIYFKVLLLTLQFERAIDYLYKNEKCRLSAVHFAVALAYYGLLQMPKDLLAASIDLLTVEADGEARLNFGRLIYQYVRVFMADKPKDALQYIYLLTLFSDRNDTPSDDVMNLCHSYIRELVLSSKDYKILGTKSPGLSREPGLIDTHRELIGITSEKQYVQAILLPIAERCNQENRYTDAVFVYDLAADYNKVIDILNEQLGEALQQARKPGTRNGPAPDTYANEESLIQFSIETLQKYSRQHHIGPLIKEHKKRTVQMLIQLVRFRRLYETGEYEQALQLVEQSGVIPLHDNLQEVQRVAGHVERLDEAISKNVPDLLLMVTDILYKQWRKFQEPHLHSQPAAKQAVVHIEESMRAVLAFVGMIRLKMPADTFVKLNRAQMTMAVAAKETR